MDLFSLLKRNVYPITGGIIGLILAVLLINYGLFKTILILFFVILGVYVALYLKKTRILDNLFK